MTAALKTGRALHSGDWERTEHLLALIDWAEEEAVEVETLVRIGQVQSLKNIQRVDHLLWLVPGQERAVMGLSGRGPARRIQPG